MPSTFGTSPTPPAGEHAEWLCIQQDATAETAPPSGKDASRRQVTVSIGEFQDGRANGDPDEKVLCRNPGTSATRPGAQATMEAGRPQIRSFCSYIGARRMMPMRCAVMIGALLAIQIVMASAIRGSDVDGIAIDIIIADVPGMIGHWSTSIYAQTIDRPEIASLRKHALASITGFQRDIGIDVMKILPAIRRMRLQLIGEGDLKAMALIVQADAGPAGDSVFASLAKGMVDAQVAGADAALQAVDGNMKVIRYGESILIVSGKSAMALRPAPIPASDDDVSVSIDMGKVIGQFLERRHRDDPERPGIVAELAGLLSPYAVPIHLGMAIEADGIRTSFRMPGSFPWLAPVDPGWTSYLPESTFVAGCLSIDGTALWKDMVRPWIGYLASSRGMSEDAVEREIDQGLQASGMPFHFADLVQGINGSIFTSSSKSEAGPAFTVGIHRSDAIDQVLLAALTRVGAKLPEIGQACILTIPGLPSIVTILRSERFWVATTDSDLAHGWKTGSAHPWTSTHLGEFLETVKGEAPCLVVVSDTASEVHVMRGKAERGFQGLPWSSDEQQAVRAAFSIAEDQAGPSYQVLRRTNGEMVGTSKGILGLGSLSTSLLALSVIYAIPNFIEDHYAANEAITVALLKDRILPAEVIFRAGRYRDRSKAGKGDFGFFQELASGVDLERPGSTRVSLLPQEWNAARPQKQGYGYCIYLPDGKGGALAPETDLGIAERIGKTGPGDAFVVYAWPMNQSQGRRIFAMTQTGKVYAHATTNGGDSAPEWNELFGNKSWADQPTWPVYAPAGNR